MSSHAVEYSYGEWNEETVAERDDGTKVTVVKAAAAYAGDLAAQTRVAFVMHYRADGSGSYDGWEEVTGTFAGEPASVVLRHEGTFDAEAVEVIVRSVPGSASGSLDAVALSFSARFEGHGPYPVELVTEGGG